MARFEWAQIDAYDGPGLATMDPSVLNSARPEKIKLYLQPYIKLLELNYPLDDYLIALRKDRAQRSEAGSDNAPVKSSGKAVLPKKQKTFLAIHRFQNSLYYKRLDKPSFVLLSELSKGATLGDACVKAYKFLSKEQKDSTEGGGIIFQWFNSWSGLNWFCVGSSRAKKR
jgi:hypothetical protein